MLRRSLEPRLVGRRIRAVEVRSKALREPLERAPLRALEGRTVLAVRRRAKYLWIDCSGGRTLALHLGMSGRVTLAPRGTAPEAHEHLAFELDSGERLRLRDPRRFGAAFALATRQLANDSHFVHLGIEPLDPPLDGARLAALARGCRAPVKTFLMDGRRLVGVGNIYAAEALFRAAVHPARPVSRIGDARWRRLASAVVEVLEEAIREGGTTLNDFTDGEGAPGEFQLALAVYGREGEECPRCRATIRRVVQAGRSTFYCPGCQR